METFALIAGSIAVGLIIGILSGLLGIGGGTVLVPVFKLLYGMPAIGATATSLFTIIPTSISGFVGHLRNKTCIPALGVAAGIGGAIMSPVGVWLASVSPEWVVMIAAAAVIAYSAGTMFSKAVKLWRKKAKAHAMENRDNGDTRPLDVDSTPSTKLGNRRMAVIGFAIGLVAGIISGYVGVGGGFIMVPMFMQLLHTPLKMTSGTSLIAILILAIPATVTQAMMGNIDWVAGIMVAVGTIPGAYIGSKLISRVSELALRFTFSIFLLIAATLLVLNQLHVF